MNYLIDIRNKAVHSKDYISPEEFETILSACYYQRDRLFLEMIWFAGMTSLEIAAVRIENIDFDAKTLKVVYHKPYKNIYVHYTECRVIHLCDRLVNEIGSYLENLSPPPKSGYLFHNMAKKNKEEEPISPYDFITALNRFPTRFDRTKFKKQLTVSGLLKGRAVQMIDSGAPMIDICRFFGTESLDQCGIFGHKTAGALDFYGTIEE